MFFLISFFWFIRTIKTILFWVYLWQLKEYHLGRFLDHFRTEKGKRLIFNYLQFLKIFLISGPFLFSSIFPFILIFLYFGETAIFIRNFLQKRLIKPVLTKKTVLILSIAISGAILIPIILYLSLKNLIWIAFWLLIIDIFLPILISLLVLILQPLAVLGRYQIIKRAKEKKAQFEDLLVIGITGSYGKTSTKEFLATILEDKFKVLKTKEHQNSEVGISQCILNDLKPEYEIFIVEMGAYNRGGIKLLCDITKPKIGILTGINEQHMATFGSQENIIRAKYELIESLPERGLAIFNGDNKFCLELYQKTHRSKRLCGKKSAIARNLPETNFDLWVEDIKVEKDFISFKVFSRNGESSEFKVNLLGANNVENILLASCCAKELGMSLKEIARACEKIQPEQGAMKLLRGKNGLNIIDSTYSANPHGVISHLEYLKIWPSKKVIVMPCLIELGRASKEVHKRIGEKIGEVCDLAIITTKDKYKEIREGALKGGMTEIDIFYFEDPKEIYDKIKAFCRPGDVILLESRVPKQLISLLVT
jgi:UDP-N-acetylmuramoyl-tripeptide--D-alanyl-D-alanine ligase